MEIIGIAAEARTILERRGVAFDALPPTRPAADSPVSAAEEFQIFLHTRPKTFDSVVEFEQSTVAETRRLIAPIARVPQHGLEQLTWERARLYRLSILREFDKLVREKTIQIGADRRT